jgi:hypothetical protein
MFGRRYVSYRKTFSRAFAVAAIVQSAAYALYVFFGASEWGGAGILHKAYFYMYVPIILGCGAVLILTGHLSENATGFLFQFAPVLGILPYACLVGFAAILFHRLV